MYTKFIKDNEVESITRNADFACIPIDPNNIDYVAYLKWLAAGNTPGEYVLSN